MISSAIAGEKLPDLVDDVHLAKIDVQLATVVAALRQRPRRADGMWQRLKPTYATDPKADAVLPQPDRIDAGDLHRRWPTAARLCNASLTLVNYNGPAGKGAALVATVLLGRYICKRVIDLGAEGRGKSWHVVGKLEREP